MCGILGMSFLKGSGLSKDPASLMKVMNKLFEWNKYRGMRATGVAFVGERVINVLKYAERADTFIEREDYKKLFIEHTKNISENGRLLSILGHCRLDTKGTPRNNDNNHPIITNGIVGVHNGWITNDNELFKGCEKERIAQVDSEAMFYTLARGIIDHKTGPDKRSNIMESVREAMSKVMGSFSVAAVENTNPYLLWLIRDYMPCTVIHSKTPGVVVFGSVVEEKEFGDFGFHGSEEITFAKNEILALDTETNCVSRLNLK